MAQGWRCGVADKQPSLSRWAIMKVMTMAGLWPWKNPEDGQWLRSCTIVTTEANEMMAPIHDRMPVILGSEDREKWLGEVPANSNQLKAMLKPFRSARMTSWPVGKAVGNVKNDMPDLIARTPVQISLI
jgi:putative SOS response-associated peptidase YedK